MNPSADASAANLREALDDATAPAEPWSGEPVLNRVAAVFVSHNGAHFLERTLASLRQLETKPDRLVAVDVGSQDNSVEMLSAAGSPVSEVIRVPASTGFAVAVHAGVDAAGASEWVWVLHDDCAPDPDALAVLLAATADQSSVAVVGPKVLGWDEPRRLLEVGVSISRSGRRYTGLESHEQDQGQYESQRDVLAVGSAGLLVRREVWDLLGGFDRALRLFREDVDFGWRVNLAGHRVVVVPDAVLHHAEAVAHGRRELVMRQLHQQDRASALYVLLANSSRTALFPRWLLLFLVSLLRSLGFLLGKSPQEAAGEMGAIGQVLLRPRQLGRGRRSRSRHKTVAQGSLRSLFPPPGQQLRQSLETVVGALTVNAELQPSSVLETGPSDDDDDSFVGQGSGRLRRALRRPGSLLFFGLLTVELLAWRGLYRDGVLHGGALLPVPSGASDLWDAYLASWHPVVAGSPVAAHPSIAVLGALAFLLFGHATWVVPLVMVLGPALAGFLTYLVLASFGLSLRLRVWAAVAYALNPAVLAAIGQGRWGTVIVAVLLPLLGLALARAAGFGAGDPSTRAAASAALLFAVVTAVAPVMWLPLALLGALTAWRFATLTRVRWRLVGVVVAPLLLLLPWLPTALRDPSLLLLESGVPLASNPQPPWHVLLLSPGGLTVAPMLLGAGLVVAGVAAVARAAEVRAVRSALVVAGVGLVWALVLDCVSVTPAFSALPVAPWAGTSLVLASAGLITAAAISARSVRSRLERRGLSWRQPAVALVAALAVLAPLTSGLWWLGRGAAGPLDRGEANPLPAFVRAQSDLPTGIRTLVLKPENGRLTYTLLRQRAAELGDTETTSPASRLGGLDQVVADLASGRGAAPVDNLAVYGVQYILAVPPVDPALESALDSAPGVLRVANQGGSSLWRIDRPTGRLRLVDSKGTVTVLPSDPVDTQAALPSGTGDRLLELGELSDPGWHATEDGRDLPSQQVSGWAQGFTATSAAGEVTIVHRDPLRWALVVGQAVAWLVIVVIALPSRRRETEETV